MIAQPVLHIGPTATRFPGSVAEAAQHFAAQHVLHVEQAFDLAFLATIMTMLQGSAFVPGVPAGTILDGLHVPGFREIESPQRVGRVLNLAINRPALLRWLEEVTGCGPLVSIEGRVVQTLARPGDELDWHDDLTHLTPERRLALVIDLSPAPYTGGEFEMRWKTGEVFLEHRHETPGSMLLFRINDRLEHRVLPVASGGPRRVFAGWALGGEPA